jgi:ribonuclease P protein component
VLNRGRRVFGKFVTLRFLASPNNSSTRVGFIVSKKVHNKPVKRNLVKRRLRAIVARALPNIVPNIDVLFSSKSQAVGATYVQLQDESLDLLKKAQIIKEVKNL